MQINFSLKHLLLGVLMLLAAGGALAIKPSVKLADKYDQINLEAFIPKEFGDWKQEQTAAPIVSPDLKTALDKIYAQTLTRTYINSHGEHIMLSIAYGKDQSDSLSIHSPEGCYGGQGFAIQNQVKAMLATAYGKIPVARLFATKGERHEPITYWITIGEHAVYDEWEMKKVKLNYALKGIIPDGLLFRVSSINSLEQEAYDLQANFAEALLSSLSPAQRMRLMGFSSS